jgi:hypothetical protein
MPYLAVFLKVQIPSIHRYAEIVIPRIVAQPCVSSEFTINEFLQASFSEME